MNFNCYLIIEGVKPKFGPDPETRREPGVIYIRKQRPKLKASEIAIKLNLEIPDSLFVTPQLEAKVSVPDVAGGPVITAEVAENIAEVVRQQTGLSLSIQAEPAEERK